MKKAWIIAGSCILAGLLVLLIGLIAIGGDFKKLSTEKYESKQQTIEEEFSALAIDLGSSDVTILPSTDGSCTLSYMDSEKDVVSVAVQEGVLVVTEEDHRKWYDYIGIYFGRRKATLTLPEKVYESMEIKVGSGEIKLVTGISAKSTTLKSGSGDILCSDGVFEAISLQASSGDIELLNSKAENLTAKTSSGDIDLTGVEVATTLTANAGSGEISFKGIKTEGAISLSVNSGEIELENVECGELIARASSGDIECKNVLSVGKSELYTGSGDIHLELCDAASYKIQTSSGNVKGTLRSAKIFYAQASSGKVNVPNSTEGGVCEVKTGSGNIRLEILG